VVFFQKSIGNVSPVMRKTSSKFEIHSLGLKMITTKGEERNVEKLSQTRADGKVGQLNAT
jgi:hypothetical protein